MAIRDIDVYLNERFVDEEGDVVDGVTSVNGMVGDVVIEKKHIGLENVNNTSDLDKPISTATQTALNAKANNTDLVPIQNEINSNEIAIQSVADDLSDFASQTATNLALKADKAGNIASATKLETARTINGILLLLRCCRSNGSRSQRQYAENSCHHFLHNNQVLVVYH